MNNILDKVIDKCRPYIQEGKLADYIPELTKANPNDFGIYMISKDGTHYTGDYDKCFTIQSIVKPILLLQALIDNGIEDVKRHVGVEATGKPFDAINYNEKSLLSENINPMVNIGAIAMTSLIKGNTYKEKFNRILDLTRKLANNPDINIDEDVYQSEKETGNKNRALGYLLKAYGLIEDDIEDVLDCYFRACSIKMSCKDIAHMGLVLAHHGVNPLNGEVLFPKQYASYVNAILITCGMYDGSGDFAIKVGVPAKSGVGGGIMAVVPLRMGIGIYSPSLNNKGNSIAGIKALELLSDELELSIF